ncbi:MULTISPECIES: hypothetical protein [Streptomyces]|uniref:hypothetical protein n=1 Tax=Streptomyces TaxID=1883 RepID=UPI0006AE729D|nr:MULTISPECIES: hypothetical protein [unclassified Streptomyces]KOU92404.1 hypothetical protein ADK94_06740 [Streptomyces sp. XY593]KOV04850.1 hypothetical protein ADK92_07710 [Streptomyces sp. XY533]KOV13709.1 hypothetical protein ADK91_08665 [Streptomyces sp. XY511]RSS89629.1 hypothetical protein EF904_32340 [Streptomyces sp. WAC05950]
MTERQISQPIAEEQVVFALLTPDPYPRSRGYVSVTRLMQKHRAGLWVRIRELMAEHGLNPADTVLVYLFPTGPSTENGVLLSDGGRVYDFELMYDREKNGADRRAGMAYWHDITDRWQTTPFSRKISDAFIWRPPASRTILSTTTLRSD